MYLQSKLIENCFLFADDDWDHLAAVIVPNFDALQIHFPDMKSHESKLKHIFLSNNIFVLFFCFSVFLFLFFCFYFSVFIFLFLFFCFCFSVFVFLFLFFCFCFLFLILMSKFERKSILHFHSTLYFHFHFITLFSPLFLQKHKSAPLIKLFLFFITNSKQSEKKKIYFSTKSLK
jgi:hypothetical protein